MFGCSRLFKIPSSCSKFVISAVSGLNFLIAYRFPLCLPSFTLSQTVRYLAWRPAPRVFITSNSSIVAHYFSISTL
jgi:hypothetical protein